MIIARWLAYGPRVLLLNDPTRGIDIGAKNDLYALFGALAAEGLAVVMLSTELDEHVELMDRVLVFREHELFKEFERSEVTRERLVARSSASRARPEMANVPMEPAVEPARRLRDASRSPTRTTKQRLTHLAQHHSYAFAALLMVAVLVATIVKDGGNFGVSDQLGHRGADDPRRDGERAVDHRPRVRPLDLAAAGLLRRRLRRVAGAARPRRRDRRADRPRRRRCSRAWSPA